MRCKSLFVAICASAAWLVTPVLHASVLFNGTGTGPGGVPVNASALFDILGNQLTITLTNTSPSNNGQDVPGSTLTGIFWSFANSNPLLTPVSATVPSGSSIIQTGTCNPGPCSGVTNVGGEFGYQAAAFGQGSDRGIASSGYLSTGLPGNIGNFGGINLDDPASLDGINFGIVSAAPGLNPNGGLDAVPLISNSVVFVLSGVLGLSTDAIRNVSFQYGTALNELNVPGTPGTSVPEPGTLALLGLGLWAYTVARRRKSS